MMQLSASFADWKLVYRVLHSQLQDREELVDADIMQDLQSKLQDAARDAGVDVDDHEQWVQWLRGTGTPSLKLVE